MFRILFDLSRSLILNKDLLLHVNLFKDLNLHTKHTIFCLHPTTHYKLQPNNEKMDLSGFEKKLCSVAEHLPKTMKLICQILRLYTDFKKK